MKSWIDIPREDNSKYPQQNIRIGMKGVTSRKTHHAQAEFILEMQSWLNSQQSVHAIQRINTLNMNTQ